MDSEEILSEEPTLTVRDGWTLEMDAKETLTLFQSLRTHLQYLSQQDDPPLDSLNTVIGLLASVRPAAVQAAQALNNNK